MEILPESLREKPIGAESRSEHGKEIMATGNAFRTHEDFPLVSIVTPCYNGESFIDRYFRSVLDQTWPALELIFVDDGSKDKTKAIAASYEDMLRDKGIRFRFLHQENAGQAAALNQGIKYVTGKYLVWPDSDDEMTSDSIEKKVRFLEEHPEYDFCVCAVKLVDDDHPREPEKLYRREIIEGKETLLEHFVFNEIMLPGSFMMRTALLDSAIPGREIYTGRGGQNPQLLLPAAWYGKLGYMDDVLYIYHIRKDSHSRDSYDSIKTIRQLQYYEEMCIATIQRIPDPAAQFIIPKIQQEYAGRRFGTAVDTMDSTLISRYYYELKEVRKPTIKETLLTIKYTNPLLRLFFGIKNGAT